MRNIDVDLILDCTRLRAPNLMLRLDPVCTFHVRFRAPRDFGARSNMSD